MFYFSLSSENLHSHKCKVLNPNAEHVAYVNEIQPAHSTLHDGAAVTKNKKRPQNETFWSDDKQYAKMVHRVCCSELKTHQVQ